MCDNSQPTLPPRSHSPSSRQTMLRRSIPLLLFAVIMGCSEQTSRRSAAAEAVDAVSDGPPRLVIVEVGGMVCQGCVARVEEKLKAVPGVHRVDVSLADQRAVVLCDSTVADTALTGAVRRAGPEFVGLVSRR